MPDKTSKPSATPEPNPATRAVLRQKNECYPLPDAVRDRAEQLLGISLGDVRVHSGPLSSAAAMEQRTEAFTVRSDIVFGPNQYRPETLAGKRLIAHELAHVVQQRDARMPAEEELPDGRLERAESEAARLAEAIVNPRPGMGVGLTSTEARIARNDPVPPGFVETDDPDNPLAPDPSTVPSPDDEEAIPITHRDFEFAVSERDPTIFLVPAEATMEDVAARLAGDEELTASFDFVAGGGETQRGVRFRSYGSLVDGAYGVLRTALDHELDADVATTTSLLSERSIDEGEERQMAGLLLKWSQRSNIRDAAGAQYFDKYLTALRGVTLTEEFWGTSKNALDWLMEESASHLEMMRKAIELRSGRYTSGYTVTDAAPELQKDAAVGRFFYSNTENQPMQLVVWERIAAEDTFERAERATRSRSASWLRVVIPGSDGRFYGYSILHHRHPPRHKNDIDFRPAPSEDPDGHYYWYYPGTVAIGGNEFRVEFPRGGEDAQRHRRELLDAALADTSRELGLLTSLDFEVLSVASTDERFTIIERMLGGRGKETEAGVALIARVILATPAADFPAMERRMSTEGMMSRFYQLTRMFPALAVVGRAFTLKTITSMPPGVESLADMESFDLGHDESGEYYFAFSSVHRAQSQTVGAESWNPQAAAKVGSEPARAGETPGAFERDVIVFNRAVFTGGIRNIVRDYVDYLGGDVGENVVRNVGPKTRELLPTELVRINVIGKHPDTRIVTALEAAGMLDLSFAEFLSGAVMPAVNISLYAMALGGLAAGAGAAVIRGAVSGGLEGAIAALGTQAAVQSLKTFAWQALILGSMAVVDAYRSELEESEAGRAFLAVYDIAMVALVARDVYKVVASGIFGELARTAVAAMSAVSDASRAGLSRAVIEWRALGIAADKLAAARARVLAAATGALPEAEIQAQTLSMAMASARAEAYSTAAVTSLRAAGESTTDVERLFNRLKPLADEAAEVAQAQRLFAQKLATLRGPALQDTIAAIERTLSNPRGLTTELGNFLKAAAKSGDPIAYLAQVDILIAKKQVALATLEVLGAKAADGTLDLAWLNSTSLTQADLNWLGRNPKTPWGLFQAGATSGNPAVQRWALSAVRGAGAEKAAKDLMGRILPNFSITDSQVPMGTSVIDYQITAQGIGTRHGFEIKGWTSRTWRDALDAYRARSIGATLTADQARAIRKIDHMLGQLHNAAANRTGAPYLGVTDAMRGADRTALDALLNAEGLGNVTVVPMSEDAILAVNRRLRTALGIPLPTP